MLVGAIGILVFLATVFLGMPVAFGIIGVALFGYSYMVGPDIAGMVLSGSFVHYVARYSFSVLPMFIFMGQLGYQSGLLADIFTVARRWLGWAPGGLAMSVTAACAVFGACSGSGVAAVTVVGQSALPTMRKAGYSDELSAGVICASGTLAQLIPPSALLCFYGLVVEQSIGKLFIAGIVPGMISALIYMLFIISRSTGKRSIQRESATWKERFYSIRYLWVVGVVMMSILGGIYFGVITPTEGGAAGAFTVFMLALIQKKLTLRILWNSLRATVITTSMIGIMIVGSVYFSNFLGVSGFSGVISATLVGLEVPRIVVFLIILVVFELLGCVIDPGGILVMTLPVVYPIMMSLGFDPIWLGIIVIKFSEMAFITPPVGVCLFALTAVAPDVSLMTAARGAAPFLLMDLLTIALFYAFPELITFLPDLM